MKLGRALERMGACVERTFNVGTCDVVVAPYGWRDGAEGREEEERWVANAQAAGKWAVSEKWVWACVSAAKCVSGQEFVLGRASRSLDSPGYEGEEKGRMSEICCRMTSRIVSPASLHGFIAFAHKYARKPCSVCQFHVRACTY